MNQYVFITIIIAVVGFAIIALVMMTRNNGKVLYEMADIFETDIFSDIDCFSKCLETCLVERAPELSEDQKLTCEQECGLLCANDAPSFRF